jgi:hypothetical protein
MKTLIKMWKKHRISGLLPKFADDKTQLIKASPLLMRCFHGIVTE